MPSHGVLTRTPPSARRRIESATTAITAHARAARSAPCSLHRSSRCTRSCSLHRSAMFLVRIQIAQRRAGSE